MENIYLVIVGILMALAVMGLVVGVANDAVNFLNSALGSKVAPRHIILIIASIGIVVGAMTSNGMMEIARSGVFHPGMFSFSEIMMLFLAVMFMNVILLDIFNTFGLPTSTTVTLVFGLLGAAVGVSIFKIAHDPNSTMSDLGRYINSGKALAIIAGILLSVALAFFSGTVIMYFTRLIFSFKYKKKMKHAGAIWCAIAITAISHFAVFKGLKGTSLISREAIEWMSGHTFTLLVISGIGWSIVMSVLSLLKVNILKITVLAGTLSLALAFAGNDLVNFIGVFVAGLDSYRIVSPTGDATMLMGDLMKPAHANYWALFISGIIMVLTLWFSKKAKTVTETEINLARQDVGVERFGSTSLSRAVVRGAVNVNRRYEQYIPHKIQRYIESRFIPVREAIPDKEKAPFDLIRATVNLTVASILISMATAMTLPLSTTYVTFMVAMGSSLADRAWGRESAVYRITGVLTVISGWFVTAFIAFTIAFGIALLLIWGDWIAIAAFSVLCVYLLIQSTLMHNRKLRKQEKQMAREEVFSGDGDIIDSLIRDTSDTMSKVTVIYNQTLEGLFNEDRRLLKQMVRESEELYRVAHERKHGVLPTLKKLQENYIETGHYYVQVVDYLDEVAKALVHITRPSYDHINNNHEGLSKDQVHDLRQVDEQVSEIYGKINGMLETNDYEQLEDVLRMRDDLFDTFATAIKSQIKRVRTSSGSTRGSVLYLTIINETKTMLLQSRNLIKAQKYFLNKE